MKTKKNKKSQTNVLGGGGNFSCRHPKLWEYIKSNVKAFFITGAITFVVTVSATTVKILHSSQVRYKNDKSVEQAINELYEKAEQIEQEKIRKIGCEECTKLKYLESTGTQYIDTGIYNKTNTKVNISFLYLQSIGDPYSNGMIYGSSDNRDGSSTMAIGVTTGNNLYYRNSNGSDLFSNYNINQNVKYNIIVYQNQIIINDSVYSSNMSLISNKAKYTSYLFARHQIVISGTVAVNDAYAPFIGRVYFLKLYDNDVLVRDYIPVLDANGRPCMFDKVSKTCFYNQGTGEFLYG